jgi:C-terminal processing protease CtpA/Prc
MALWELDSRLSGKAGGRVRLEVVREGKPRHRTIDIVRAGWSPAPPSAQRVEGETVVRIPSFNAGAAAAIRKILEPLDRTHALILDVRNNATGTYDEAARAASLFVAAGPLGELKGRRIESKTFRAEPGERVHESRLVVLVDSGTAGPAELFASALREATVRTASSPKLVRDDKKKDDEDAADVDPGLETPKGVEKLPVRLVGETTVGMGFTAQVVKLSSGGSLKLSVGKVHTLAGKALCPRGLQPDDRVFHGPPDEATGKGDVILKRGIKILGDSARLKAAA